MTAADDARGLTSVAQDYLNVIFNVQEWSGEKVSTKMHAERIGVSPSTASESMKLLIWTYASMPVAANRTISESVLGLKISAHTCDTARNAGHCSREHLASAR